MLGKGRLIGHDAAMRSRAGHTKPPQTTAKKVLSGIPCSSEDRRQQSWGTRRAPIRSRRRISQFHDLRIVNSLALTSTVGRFWI